MTVVVAGDSFTFKVRSRDGSALLKVLGDRAPEAVRVMGLRKYRALDVVASAVTLAVLVVVALGFLHHHSAGSTTVPAATARWLARPVTGVSVGECLAALGQQTRCGSSLATFVVARCSDASAADRETIASAMAGLPELKHVIQVAVRAHLCLKLGP